MKSWFRSPLFQAMLLVAAGQLRFSTATAGPPVPLESTSVSQGGEEDGLNVLQQFFGLRRPAAPFRADSSVIRLTANHGGPVLPAGAVDEFETLPTITIAPETVQAAPPPAIGRMSSPPFAEADPWAARTTIVAPSAPVFEEEPWDWHLLPEGLLYKSYIAGEKEPRLSTSSLYQRHGETFWDSVLGGRVALMRYGTSRGIQPEGWEWQVEGGAFLRMRPQEDRDVMSTDYRIGTPIVYREGPFQWKFGYYHISSHLGDEFLLKNPGYDRLNYSRDCLVMGVGYFPVDPLRIYFEVGWAFYTTDGAEPWEIQTGIEWSSNRPTGIRGEPYAAMNVHLRQDVNWGGSVNVLVGWQWRSETSDHTFRAGLQYYNGADNQYSFLYNNTQFLGYGIRYDY